MTAEGAVAGLALDREVLAGPVSRALGCDEDSGAEVLDWEVQALDGGYGGATKGVYRVSGRGRRAQSDGSGREPLAWSMILKIVTAGATGRASQDESAMGYWKREPLAFASGLPESAHGRGLAAPHCYGVDERRVEGERGEGGEGGDGVETVWLWLEEVREAPSSVGPDGKWSLSGYATAARDVGAWQGALLAGGEVPDPPWPWLCRGKLRTWTGMATRGMERLAAAPDDAALRHYWPGDRYERLLRLWAERDTFLEALDRLPQVLTHGDFQRANLFLQEKGGGALRTVAIDWATCGIGAIGSDAATLVAANSVRAIGLPVADLPALREVVLEGYLEGLRAGGWKGDERLARIGFEAAVAMEASFLVHPAMPANDATRARRERAFGLPHEEFLERMGTTSAFALDVADEVRPLLDAVR